MRSIESLKKKKSFKIQLWLCFIKTVLMVICDRTNDMYSVFKICTY